MKTILVSAITAALVVVSLLAFNAYAGRSAGGTYTLASPGVPFQSGQVISSTQMNNTLNDIATTLTNSLDRSGNGGMLAALRGIDGTQAAPTFSWTSETSSGLFRAGAGDIRMSVTNGLRQQWTTTGSIISGTLGVGAAAADTFDVTVGAGNNVAAGFYIPTMADGTFDALLIGKSTGSSLSGQLTYTKSATVANSTWCMGLWGTQGTLCTDGNAKVIIGSGTPTSTMRHQRFGGTCTTAIGVGQGCSTVSTWTIAFADTNYTASCIGDGQTGGVPMALTILSKTATTITTLTTNNSGVNGGQFTTIDCIAFHD